MERGTKRQRGPNYTSEEVNLLINIIAEQKNVIENKKTDSVTARQKEAAWLNITKCFNSSSNSTRSTESLKKVYENKKKDVRRKVADSNKFQNTTGLGVDGSLLNVDNNDSLLLSIMNPKTVVGIPTMFGGDAVASTSSLSDVVISNLNENEEIKEDNNDELQNAEMEELNWGDFSARHLATPLNPHLRTRIAGPTQQTWSSRRRPVAASVNASALSKEYSALAKVKLECVQLEMQKIREETIESQLRQEILKIDLQLKKIALSNALLN